MSISFSVPFCTLLPLFSSTLMFIWGSISMPGNLRTSGDSGPSPGFWWLCWSEHESICLCPRLKCSFFLLRLGNGLVSQPRPLSWGKLQGRELSGIKKSLFREAPPFLLDSVAKPVATADLWPPPVMPAWEFGTGTQRESTENEAGSAQPCEQHASFHVLKQPGSDSVCLELKTPSLIHLLRKMWNIIHLMAIMWDYCKNNSCVHLSLLLKHYISSLKTERSLFLYIKLLNKSNTAS